MAKITALMNVYNQEEFLEYSLKSIYDAVDQIVIIDGAYNAKMPSRYSTDRTEQIVTSFFDERGKIEYLRTSAYTQIEQRNKVMDYINDGWLFIVDGDEVYKQDEISRLSHLLDSAKKDSYTINSYVFTNTFNWYYTFAYERLFKYKEGMHFTKPNGLAHNEGAYLPSCPIPKITMYHYAYMGKRKRLAIKQLQCKINLDWEKGWMIPQQPVQRFEGEHPHIMLDHPYAKLKWNAGEHEIC